MRIFLTAAIAFALVVMLAGLVCLCYTLPLATPLAIGAMAVNGRIAVEAVSAVWNLDGEVA